MDEIKYNRSNPRYKSGQFYKHNKHGFIIQLISNKGTFGKWIFRVLAGEIPPTLRPEYASPNSKLDKIFRMMNNDAEIEYEKLYQYGTDSLRQSFTLISGKGAEVLFGTSNRD